MSNLYRYAAFLVGRRHRVRFESHPQKYFNFSGQIATIARCRFRCDIPINVWSVSAAVECGPLVLVWCIFPAVDPIRALAGAAQGRPGLLRLCLAALQVLRQLLSYAVKLRSCHNVLRLLAQELFYIPLRGFDPCGRIGMGTKEFR